MSEISLSRLRISVDAYVKARWMTGASTNELSAMGILTIDNGGLLLNSLILCKQEVSTASINLDVEWWADKLAALSEDLHVEPWQTQLWFHTHPAGCKGPSAIDEATMAEDFGQWDFATMLILPKGGDFYCRTDCRVHIGGAVATTQVRQTIELDTSHIGDLCAGSPRIWQAELDELVTERPIIAPRSERSEWWDRLYLPDANNNRWVTEAVRRQETAPQQYPPMPAWAKSRGVTSPAADNPALYDACWYGYCEDCWAYGLDPTEQSSVNDVLIQGMDDVPPLKCY